MSLKPIRIVTDSTCDLPEDLVGDLGIIVVPLYVRFGEKSFREGVDISREEFYRRLGEGERPSTSQPAPGDFYRIYESHVEAGEQVMSLHLSGKLSGTVNSALGAKNLICDEYEDAQIAIVDSHSASLGLGQMVTEAALMAQEGRSEEEIRTSLSRMVSNARAILVVGDLDYLSRGGRITKAQAFFGSLLNVMPLIALEEGSLSPVARAMGMKGALKKMIEFIENKCAGAAPSRIAFVHGSLKEEMEALAALGNDAFPDAVKISGRAGAVIASHVGPSVMAALWH
jgi:DegV family protein with EDD domain